MVNVRKTTEADKPRLSEWIAKDSCPQHHGVDAAWWTTDEMSEETPMGSRCFVVENENGPVFYLKTETVMRCFIQFPPDSERNPEATREALKRAFGMFATGAKKLGYKEIIFDSQSAGLINFFSTMGFKEAKDNWLARL